MLELLPAGASGRSRCASFQEESSGAIPKPQGRSGALALGLAALLLASTQSTSRARADEETGATKTGAAKTRLAAARRAPLPTSARVYASASPAVVGITCRKGRASYFGTGALVSPQGLVLTSVTVVPADATAIRVYLPGGRIAEARPVLSDDPTELSLVRLKSPERFVGRGKRTLPYLRLGNSQGLRLGEEVFTLGNSFQSIVEDDQVSMAAGLVSGFFELEEKRSESTYIGHAIETSAALNNGMDGGPLVDAQGRFVGLLSLNFAPSRWLGTAVPVHRLLPLLREHLDCFDDRGGDRDLSHYLGLELARLGSSLELLAIDPKGPAAKAGLVAGDRIEKIGKARVRTAAEFRAGLERARPGQKIELTVRREDGKQQTISVELWGRF